VFPVKYKHRLYIKESKVIPVTDCGGPYMLPMRYKHDYI
jgi:hypothetical protein